MADRAEVRPHAALGPAGDADTAWIAARMRATLVEVLGESVGGGMYAPDWLAARVRRHLHPDAAVFLAWRGAERVGHAFVREEADEDGAYALHGTTWVEPEARRSGAARALHAAIDAWAEARGLARSATYTASTNHRLIALYRSEGYHVAGTAPDGLGGTFVHLARAWPGDAHGQSG